MNAQVQVACGIHAAAEAQCGVRAKQSKLRKMCIRDRVWSTILPLHSFPPSSARSVATSATASSGVVIKTTSALKICRVGALYAAPAPIFCTAMRAVDFERVTTAPICQPTRCKRCANPRPTRPAPTIAMEDATLRASGGLAENARITCLAESRAENSLAYFHYNLARYYCGLVGDPIRPSGFWHEKTAPHRAIRTAAGGRMPESFDYFWSSKRSGKNAVFAPNDAGARLSQLRAHRCG